MTHFSPEPNHEVECIESDRPSSPQLNFVIPGAAVVIRNTEEPGAMPIGEFLSIVFQVASANPNCKVKFWMEVKG